MGIMEDEAGVLEGEDASLIFHDPFLGLHTAAPQQSPPISPKTVPKLTFSISQPPTHDRANSCSTYSSSGSEKTITAPDVKSPSIYGKTGRILLSNKTTTQLQTYLLARRRFAEFVKEADKRQSELDTQAFDLLDEIIALQARSASTANSASYDSRARCSSSDNTSVYLYRQTSSLLAATPRKRQSVLQQKKDLPREIEKLRQIVENKRTKLDDNLDAFFEESKYLPRTRVPQTPVPVALGDISIALHEDDEEFWKVEREEVVLVPGTRNTNFAGFHASPYVAGGFSDVPGNAGCASRPKVPVTSSKDPYVAGGFSDLPKAGRFGGDPLLDLLIDQGSSGPAKEVNQGANDKESRILNWRDQVLGSVGRPLGFRSLFEKRAAKGSFLRFGEEPKKPAREARVSRMFSFSRSKAAFGR